MIHWFIENENAFIAMCFAATMYWVALPLFATMYGLIRTERYVRRGIEPNRYIDELQPDKSSVNPQIVGDQVDRDSFERYESSVATHDRSVLDRRRSPFDRRFRNLHHVGEPSWGRDFGELPAGLSSVSAVEPSLRGEDRRFSRER